MALDKMVEYEGEIVPGTELPEDAATLDGLNFEELMRRGAEGRIPPDVLAKIIAKRKRALDSSREKISAACTTISQAAISLDRNPEELMRASNWGLSQASMKRN